MEKARRGIVGGGGEKRALRESITLIMGKKKALRTEEQQKQVLGEGSTTFQKESGASRQGKRALIGERKRRQEHGGTSGYIRRTCPDRNSMNKKITLTLFTEKKNPVLKEGGIDTPSKKEEAFVLARRLKAGKGGTRARLAQGRDEERALRTTLGEKRDRHFLRGV